MVKEISKYATVIPAQCDQCMFGQTVEIYGKIMPARKRTTFMTNCPGVASALRVTCPGKHKHAPLDNWKAGTCRVYPPRLVTAFLKGLSMQLHADKTSLRKQAKAAPAPQRQHPEALSVTDSYIVDTGCGKDLISKEMVGKWSAHICQTTPLELHTAGGLTHTTIVVGIDT